MICNTCADHIAGKCESSNEDARKFHAAFLESGDEQENCDYRQEAPPTEGHPLKPDAIRLTPTILHAPFPDDWKDQIRALPQKQPIRGDQAYSAGFTDLNRTAGLQNFDLDGIHAVVSYVIDERRIDGKTLKERIAAAESEWCESHGKSRTPPAIRKEIKETETAALLPMTSPKRKRVPVYFDSAENLILIGTANESRAAEIRKALGFESNPVTGIDIFWMVMPDTDERAKLAEHFGWTDTRDRAEADLSGFLDWLRAGYHKPIGIDNRITVGDGCGNKLTMRGDTEVIEVEAGIAAGRHVERAALVVVENEIERFCQLGSNCVPGAVKLGREPVLAILEYEHLCSLIGRAIYAYLMSDDCSDAIRRSAVARVVERAAAWCRETGQMVLWEEAGATEVSQNPVLPKESEPVRAERHGRHLRRQAEAVKVL